MKKVILASAASILMIGTGISMKVGERDVKADEVQPVEAVDVKGLNLSETPAVVITDDNGEVVAVTLIDLSDFVSEEEQVAEVDDDVQDEPIVVETASGDEWTEITETWNETVEPVVEETIEETVEEQTVETPAYVEWDGSRLTAMSGIAYGPSGKETYYNLNMSGVVSIMRNMGYDEVSYPYWVRDDGCKMLGDYIIVAADLNAHPRGSIIPTSLGDAIVCDTGSFTTNGSGVSVDIATSW